MAYAFPNIPVGSRILVTFYGESLNNIVMNTFCYRLSSIATAKTVGQAYDELQGELDAAGELKEKFLDCMPGNYTLNEVWMQMIATTRYVKVVYPKDEIGTSGEAGETNNLQGTIVRRGVAATRPAVGALRLMLPTSTNVVNDGLIETAYKTKMNALCTAMEKTHQPASNNIYVPVINNGVGSLNYTDIGDCFAKDEVRVLRRRTLRVGI